MTRLDIAKVVATEANLTQQKANEAVIGLFNVLKDALKNGERIECRGFGIFIVRDRSARIGRNPRTGEEAPISRGKTIKFKPGKEFKERVGNGIPVSLPIDPS
ncbi:integration host factor subunit beta [candidate division KSB3 bacterium]|uniref:Integration host factor subunit beta n=1 Tax=candidate division KSB3 bacterium TaxID=2044937 RepID=A0A9D5JTS2_9BACT|nr:integration host factor subunit beta [candidate division KSB3 bacterium]MBD3324035.1 integration host factor subunit beta [candidate division KSB3 bacterium]